MLLARYRWLVGSNNCACARAVRQHVEQSNATQTPGAPWLLLLLCFGAASFAARRTLTMPTLRMSPHLVSVSLLHLLQRTHARHDQLSLAAETPAVARTARWLLATGPLDF